MKTLTRKTLPARAGRGFTLIELLVVMAIIAILATLSLGAFTYAQQAASRNRTTSSHAAIASALEGYKEKFGEYPKPVDDSDHTIEFTSKSGAQMLYQAITGDGSDALVLASAGDSSDGNVDGNERENAINSALPPGLIYPPFSNLSPGSAGARYLIDGFGRPFQYTKGGDPNAINPTYDLWSYGNYNVAGAVPANDLAGKKNAANTATWIKNW